MLITRVVLDDFFGFHHLDLSGLDALGSVVVVGKNGAGKSSVLDGIRWGLYGRFRDKGDKVIKRRANEASVRIEFTARGAKWVVVRRKPRDKTGTLHLFRALDALQGVASLGATAHTTAETQARIDLLIGLSYPAMLSTALMVQTDDERNDLARMDPAKGMDLLTELFDMTDYPALHEQAKERQAIAKSAVVVADTRLGDLRGIVADEKEAREALAVAETQLAARVKARDEAQALVEEAKVAMATSGAVMARAHDLAQREASLTVALAQAREDTDRHRIAIERSTALREAAPPEAPVVGDGDAALMTEARARLDSVHEASAEYAGLTAEKAHLQREVDRMDSAGTVQVPCNREGIYATCPLLVNLPSEDMKAAVHVKWDRLTARLSELQAIVDLKQELAAELYRLEEEQVAEQRQAARFEAEHAAWAHRRELARDAVNESRWNLQRAVDDITRMTHEMDQVQTERAETVQAEATYREAQAAKTAAQNDLASATSVIRNVAEPFAARARSVVAQVDLALSQLPAAEAAYAKATTDQKTWETLAKAFHRDGIPRLVVEEGLPVIEDAANEVLARMPEDMSLRLVTQGITKAGTVSAPTLTVEVTHEGELTAYDMLSGAQKFRVDLALRLGMGRVITRRSGATIETLLLDEPDRDLDEEGRDALIESLNAVSDDFGLIMVISHHPFLADRMAHRLDVTRAYGESEAVLS